MNRLVKGVVPGNPKDLVICWSELKKICMIGNVAPNLGILKKCRLLAF